MAITPCLTRDKVERTVGSQSSTKQIATALPSKALPRMLMQMQQREQADRNQAAELKRLRALARWD